MSEKWELGARILGFMKYRFQYSGYSKTEIKAADYVLANGIEAAPCPPGVRAVPGYQAYCVLCGKGPPEEAEYQHWTCVDGAQNDLDSDCYQTLEDGRRVCEESDGCWKWCECEDCGGEEKIIGTDQDTCRDQEV